MKTLLFFFILFVSSLGALPAQGSATKGELKKELLPQPVFLPNLSLSTSIGELGSLPGAE